VLCKPVGEGKAGRRGQARGNGCSLINSNVRCFVKMSERRKIGDKVWIKNGAGFGVSQGEWGIIPDTEANRDDDRFPCMLNCDDDMCMEWMDVWLESGKPAYHVSECEMFSNPNPAPNKSLVANC